MFDKLAAPFPPDQVSWRVGSTNKEKTKGLALAYIDARDVMGRLDEVVGPANWQDRYEIHGTRTICYLSINLGEWVTKADGAGDSDVEAEKGSISDAFKRAAVKWGIGRYLYDLDSPWVEIEPFGRSYKIKQSEHRRLQAILGGGRAPAEKRQEPDDDRAIAYTEGALAIIRTFTGTEEDLRQWWKDQGADRRKHGLSQTQVDILKDAVTAQLSDLKAKEAA